MMLTPCWPSAGPTGGAGLAAPAWICSLMIAASFFFGGMCFSFSSVVRQAGTLSALPRDSDLADLAECQFDGCLAAEDRHQHAQLLVHAVDLADRRGQGGERAVHDGDR